MTNSKVYDIITNKIIAELEKGNIPWNKPWQTLEAPMNMTTKKPYRGINFFLLSMLNFDSPYFLTFKQAKKLGGNVRKGEKGFPVVFWNFVDVKSEDDDIKTVPFLRYYTVFNVSQCEEIEVPETSDDKLDFNPVEKAEQIISDYKDCPEIGFGGDRAYYNKLDDKIQLPNKERFETVEDFYLTAFHEMVHSTGHENRLNRKELNSYCPFGSKDYSKEELTAELGSSFLSAEAKIDNNANVKNSAAYIKGWLKALNDDRKLIVSAAGKAQQAVDFVLGRNNG